MISLNGLNDLNKEFNLVRINQLTRQGRQQRHQFPLFLHARVVSGKRCLSCLVCLPFKIFNDNLKSLTCLNGLSYLNILSLNNLDLNTYLNLKGGLNNL